MTGVYSSDPGLDHVLRMRSIAIAKRILEIHFETTTPKAFRKYALQYVSDLIRECETTSAAAEDAARQQQQKKDL